MQKAFSHELQERVQESQDLLSQKAHVDAMATDFRWHDPHCCGEFIVGVSLAGAAAGLTPLRKLEAEYSILRVLECTAAIRFSLFLFASLSDTKNLHCMGTKSANGFVLFIVYTRLLSKLSASEICVGRSVPVSRAQLPGHPPAAGFVFSCTSFGSNVGYRRCIDSARIGASPRSPCEAAWWPSRNQTVPSHESGRRSPPISSASARRVFCTPCSRRRTKHAVRNSMTEQRPIS